MPELVSSLADAYAMRPGLAARAIRELRAGQGALFLEAIGAGPEGIGRELDERLLRLLLNDERALMRFSHPLFMPLADAIALTTAMRNLDANIEVRLVRLLLAGSDPIIEDPWHASRVLEIVAAVTDGSRIRSLLPVLLRREDVRVRSKAALLLGKFAGNFTWLEQRLAERDPRVRANAVESMWGSRSAQVRDLFLLATSDPHQRVAANAVVGLYRAGDLESTRIVRRMAVTGESSLRASALWAMGESLDPRFLPALKECIGLRLTGSVHQNAIRSSVRIRSRLARLTALDPLRIHALWREGRLEVWVHTAEGDPVAALPPTAFVVSSQGGSMEIRSVRQLHTTDVARYEVQLIEPAASPLHVAVYTDHLMGEQDAR